MAKKESIFYGEGRVWGFPAMDLINTVPNQLVIPTTAQNPLQFSKDGDWGIYGYSAMYATPAAGGLASNTPVNIQIKDQNTGEDQFRQSNQRQIIGAPIEHICGKAGNPAVISWPRTVEAGARLYPYLGWLGTAAAPTGRSPWYVVAHTQLLRPGMAQAIPIGSRDMQLRRYGGYYATYTGVFDFSPANPLAPNGGDAIQIPITGKKFLFVDSLMCRMVNANIGPVSDLNPLTAESEILVSVKDTTSLSSWNQPGFVPVWTMFGSRGGRPYSPPAPFVLRPMGNIEVSIQNGPTVAIDYRIEFTFGGVLVELPESIVREASILQTAGPQDRPGILLGS